MWVLDVLDEFNRSGYLLTRRRDSGDRMWNAPNDRINQVQENSIAGFGEEPCPYVIRFT